MIRKPTINGVSFTVKKETLKRALMDFSTALKLNPNYAEVYNRRGEIWSETNDITRAMKDYTSALKLNPDFADAYCNRGILWSRKNNDDNAILDFNKAISLDPNSSKAYYHRGMALNSKGLYYPAIADYNKAIQLNQILPKPIISAVSPGITKTICGRPSPTIPKHWKSIPNMPPDTLTEGLPGPKKRILTRPLRISVRRSPSSRTTA